MRQLFRLILPLVAAFCLLDQSVTSSARVLVTRGPYLQKLDFNDVTIHWSTDQPTDSRVTYSTSLQNQNLSASNSTVSPDHAVKLTGLDAETKYYYTVGSQTEKLAGDSKYFFYTAPARGEPHPTRIWVIGDSGSANTNARGVRNAYSRFAKGKYTEVWLMLGDNAYESGTDQEYQVAVFKTFRNFLRTTAVWPTIGNHDVVLDSTVPRDLPYYDIFDLPKRGESGGVSSGTEDYYAFDYGSIHFVSLDSTTKERSPGGKMMRWLKRDLRANKKPWVIAFWHHAPYSQGTHDSDEDTAMREMRENALPILERYGVDLVLAGHSHSYQRSALLFGHYGSASSFNNSMVLDNGDGQEEDDGAYVKRSGKSVPGTVYVVAGSSGKLDNQVIKHPAMFIAIQQYGSVVIDVDDNRLDAKFLPKSGPVGDHFTIIKQ